MVIASGKIVERVWISSASVKTERALMVSIKIIQDLLCVVHPGQARVILSGWLVFPGTHFKHDERDIVNQLFFFFEEHYVQAATEYEMFPEIAYRTMKSWRGNATFLWRVCIALWETDPWHGIQLPLFSVFLENYPSHNLFNLILL